jgi:hypothetical protein
VVESAILERLARIEERCTSRCLKQDEIYHELRQIRDAIEMIKDNYWRLSMRVIAISAASGGTLAGLMKLMGV